FDNPDSKLRPGMTATVRIIAVRKDQVLRVPNAALRFKPPADLVAGTPGRDVATGAGAAPARPGAAPAGQMTGGDAGQRGAGGRGDRSMASAAPGAPSARSPGNGAGGAGGRSRGRLFRPAGDKVMTVTFKAGISDDEFTEIAGGELKEGDEVVVDIGGGSGRASGASSPSGSPAGGARRAPRVF
ncbi:MAG: hypothetical protein ABIS92_09115, partial [Polyangia bacterium]